MLTRVEVSSQYIDIPALPVGVEDSDAPIQIRDIQGLGPAAATLNATPHATSDGSGYFGGTVPQRNIVFVFGFNPNWEDQSVASLRQMLYKYFMPKGKVNLRFFSVEMGPVEIDGYVETIEPVLFSNDPEMQVSIICPENPHFRAVDETVITGDSTNPANAIAIYYEGTVPTGFDFRLERASLATVFSSFFYMNLYNSREQHFQMEDEDINQNYFFRMRSLAGQKKVESVSFVTGDGFSRLHFMTDDSEWLELEPGHNALFLVVDTILNWTIRYRTLYGGL